MSAYKKTVLSVAILGMLLVSAAGSKAEIKTEEEHLKQAQAEIKNFADELKQEFQQAVSKGGFTSAISVCAEKAPEIANKISRKTGWMVRRVSLKNRNPMNRPDEYEISVLKEFEKTAEKNEVYNHVFLGGRKEFRYMKVIRVAPLCLNCHGPEEQIDQKIKDELKQYYPHDKATGYKAKDVRGAFSVRMPLN